VNEGAHSCRRTPPLILETLARCQLRLENGELCGSTHRLQFDHVRPVALGGESTVTNLRLACAAHNLLAARRVFGDAMDRYAPA
jgi:5-methylcytosine-specific restriction endonuclease McrA